MLDLWYQVQNYSALCDGLCVYVGHYFCFVSLPSTPPPLSLSQAVEWLLAHVAHLPSDVECQKGLMAPKSTEKDVITQRSKCLELIMKACCVDLKFCRSGIFLVQIYFAF